MAKKKRNVMVGRLVRVPTDLTTDPNDKRGEIGTIVAADRERDLITLRFEDGIHGYYVFNCLEILKPANDLTRQLKDNLSNLEHDDVTIIAGVINLSMRGDHQLALQLAGTNPVVSDFCLTDTEDFYDLKNSATKEIGKAKGRRKRKAVAYIRTATGEDANDIQKNSIEKYARQQQIEIIASFKDIGQSGLNTNRNGLQDLLKYVEEHQGTISFMLVTGLDRISRSEKEYMEFEERLAAMKIETIPTNHKSPLLTKSRKTCPGRKKGL